MSDKKYSAGPWSFGIFKYDESGDFNLDVKPFDYSGPGYYDNPRIYDASGEEVCGCDEYDIFSTPENTRLMCAAPDLLEALEYALSMWGDYLPPGNSNAMKAIKQARSAIAKAKGE